MWVDYSCFHAQLQQQTNFRENPPTKKKNSNSERKWQTSKKKFVVVVAQQTASSVGKLPDGEMSRINFTIISHKKNGVWGLIFFLFFFEKGEHIVNFLCLFLQFESKAHRGIIENTRAEHTHKIKIDTGLRIFYTIFFVGSSQKTFVDWIILGFFYKKNRKWSFDSWIFLWWWYLLRKVAMLKGIYTNTCKQFC